MNLRNHGHSKLGATAAALLVVATSMPTDAAAQSAAPGGRAIGADRNRIEFYDAVNSEVGLTMEDWRRAWREDDVETIVKLYTEDAVLRLPHSAALRGRDLVERYMAAALPLTGQLQTSWTDMDASGDLAWFFGIWQHEAGASSSAGVPTGQWSGGYSLVARLENRRWRIRSQVFFAPPGQEVPGLPAVPGQGSQFDIGELDPLVWTAQTVLSQLGGALQAGDVERAVAMLSEDVTVQLFDGTRGIGQARSADMLADLFASGGGQLEFQVADFETAGPLAYALGQYRFADTTAASDGTRSGLFVSVLRQEGKDWKIRGLVLIGE